MNKFELIDIMANDDKQFQALKNYFDKRVRVIIDDYWVDFVKRFGKNSEASPILAIYLTADGWWIGTVTYKGERVESEHGDSEMSLLPPISGVLETDYGYDGKDEKLNAFSPSEAVNTQIANYIEEKLIDELINIGYKLEKIKDNDTQKVYKVVIL